MKHYLLYFFLLILSLSACKKNQSDAGEFVKDSTVSFKEAETVVHITGNTKTIHVYGIARNTFYVKASLSIVPAETTAIESVHYSKPESMMFNTPNQNKECTLVLNIIPENITNEVTLTLIIDDVYATTPGGIRKTQIKLIPSL